MTSTFCWNCNRSYPITTERCPQCNATNANVNLEASIRDKKLVELGYDLMELEKDNPYTSWERE